MNKAAIPLIVFLLMAGLFLFVLQKINTGEYDPRDIPTELILGKPWLLNVWGTWCAQCWKEHPYLMFLSRQDVPIVGINWRDDMAEARAMLKSEGNPFVESGFDPQSDAVMELGVYGAPETFLVDAQGMIKVKHKGAMSPQVWEQKFQPFFK